MDKLTGTNFYGIPNGGVGGGQAGDTIIEGGGGLDWESTTSYNIEPENGKGYICYLDENYAGGGDNEVLVEPNYLDAEDGDTFGIAISNTSKITKAFVSINLPVASDGEGWPGGGEGSVDYIILSRPGESVIFTFSETDGVYIPSSRVKADKGISWQSGYIYDTLDIVQAGVGDGYMLTVGEGGEGGEGGEDQMAVLPSYPEDGATCGFGKSVFSDADTSLIITTPYFMMLDDDEYTTIEGGESMTLEDGDHKTFMYSAEDNDWKTIAGGAAGGGSESLIYYWIPDYEDGGSINLGISIEPNTKYYLQGGDETVGGEGDTIEILFSTFLVGSGDKFELWIESTQHDISWDVRFADIFWIDGAEPYDWDNGTYHQIRGQILGFNVYLEYVGAYELGYTPG